METAYLVRAIWSNRHQYPFCISSQSLPISILDIVPITANIRFGYRPNHRQYPLWISAQSPPISVLDIGPIAANIRSGYRSNYHPFPLISVMDISSITTDIHNGYWSYYRRFPIKILTIRAHIKVAETASRWLLICVLWFSAVAIARRLNYPTNQQRLDESIEAVSLVG